MALSGASALVYETVWMRQLARAFGVTVYAVAGLVALYMSGLALGAALAARHRRAADWLRVYAGLETAAGAAALAATWWLARIPAIAASWSSEAPLPAVWRLLLAAPALLPPTILLGATLPVLARDGGEPALLYGANTLGALGGLLAAAFVTIGTWGERASVGTAFALNLSAAGAAAWLSRRGAARPAEARKAAAAVLQAVPFFIVSGFCAMGCEVLWSRELVPLLGSSTYAFAAILAVYLAGLGLGSCVRPDSSTPAWDQISALFGALGAAIALSAATTRFIGLKLDSPDFLYSPLRSFSDFPLVAAQAAISVFPASFVLGLLFPAALRLSGGDGGTVGQLYAWNTLGGIAGSLFCGFVGIELFGGHATLLLLAAIGALASMGAASFAKRRSAWKASAGFAALAAACALYARRDPQVDIIAARLKAAGEADHRVLFTSDSPAARIVGIERGFERRLYVNGIQVSGRSFGGELMAVLPSLAVREPRSTLVICFGVGSTFRAASLLGPPVDAVELVGDIVRHMPDFQVDAAEHLSKPGNRVFIEDGRGYLLRTPKRYDTILVDASPPLYSAGAVNLYTREFFELAREHLSADGAFLLWLPTMSFESDYWAILRSFTDAFPHSAVWQAPRWSGFMVLGSRRPIGWRPGELDRRIARLKKKFPWGHFDEAHLRKGFWLPEEDLRAHVASYPPVTDDRPSVEFPLARFWRGEALLATTDFLTNARRAGR